MAGPRTVPVGTPAPKVMLHPVHASKLRTVTEHIESNVAGLIGWARLRDILVESGELRTGEALEAFVIDDDGINIFVWRR